MENIETEGKIKEKNQSLITSNTSVTVLGSLSYHQQNKPTFSFDSPPFNEEHMTSIAAESQDTNTQSNTEHTLEASTNKEFTERVIEEINIELEPIADIKIPINNDQEINIYSAEATSQLNYNGRTSETTDVEDESPEITETFREESESGELNPTFTEIIADNEMDIMRKSLEDDHGAENNTIINVPDNNHVELENEKTQRCGKRKSYFDFLSDEEDFVWDSSSWKDTGDDSTASEHEKPKKKKKIRSEDGKVGEAGLKKNKVNKRKIAKEARVKGQEFVRKNGSIATSIFEI